MRTKQILTAFATLVLLGTAYVVYVGTLGRLTDFPQLESELREPMTCDDAQRISEPGVRESEVAAVRGFGPSCPQLAAPLSLESRKKSDRQFPPGRGIGIYVYADTYEIPEDNPRQIRFKPFSLVQINRSKDDDKEHDEIITGRGDEAILEFDREIKLTELSGVKPVAGWVHGNVTLKTNRRTSDPGDDIVLFTDRIHFENAKHLIWADDKVEIVIENEGSITGTGMEIQLYPEQEESKPAQTRPEVKSAQLLKDVRFALILDKDEDFLGGASKESTVPSTDARSKSEVVISARGPFVFDFETNTAVFEKLVRVLRRNPPETPTQPDSIDQLEADRLTLKFDNEEPQDSQKEKSGGGGDLRIQTALAEGTQVILMSESEKLHAVGKSLEFDAKAKRVTLIGDHETVAVQDNARIHARSLIIEQGEKNELRQLIADGPGGEMRLARKDKEGADDGEQMVVTWQERLTMRRKPDSEHQVVDIIGGVELQHERGAMTCQRLRVLLIPVTSGDSSAKTKRLEPIKLEAEGNVSAYSDRWAVNTETLLMDILHRREVAEPTKEPPTSKEPATTKVPPKSQKREETLASAQPKKPAEDELPLVVRARRVAFVLERLGAESRPVSAWAEGDVRVTQTPKSADDRPIEIQGLQLEYKRQDSGDVMEIGGSDQTPATLKSMEMTLVARKHIALDEGRNRVDVEGAGYLVMDSKNTLTGKKTETSEPVRIDWRDLMNFDGKIAHFEGEVDARQTNAKILCQVLQVTFDKAVEFRQNRTNPNSSKEKPAIEYIDCDRDVQIFDRETNEAGGVVRQSRILAPELRYDAASGTITVDGTGNVTIVEPSKGKPDARGRIAPPPLPLTVTTIDFAERLAGDRDKKTVKFYGGVKIIHSPVEDATKAIDEDQLPDQAFVIHSQRAEMAEAQSTAGQRYRLFSAIDNVKVQSRGYWAQCGRLSYDQEKDSLVLEGDRDQSATFYQQQRPGQAPQAFSARRIIYNLSTQAIRTDRAEGFNAIDLGGPARSNTPRRR